MVREEWVQMFFFPLVDTVWRCSSVCRNFLADLRVSAPQTQVAQLEATIQSAHALLLAGLIDEATSLLAAFSPEIQPNIDRALTEIRPTVGRTLPNEERW